MHVDPFSEHPGLCSSCCLINGILAQEAAGRRRNCEVMCRSTPPGAARHPHEPNGVAVVPPVLGAAVLPRPYGEAAHGQGDAPAIHVRWLYIGLMHVSTQEILLLMSIFIHIGCN